MPSSVATWSWKTWFLNATTTVAATACVASCSGVSNACYFIPPDAGDTDNNEVDSGADANLVIGKDIDTGIDTGTDAEADSGSDGAVEDGPFTDGATDGAADGGASDAPNDG